MTLRKIIGTIAASLALAVPVLAAAPPAQAVTGYYMRVHTNTLAFHDERHADRFNFTIEAHHNSNGRAVHGQAGLYINDRRVDVKSLYRGRVTWSIPRSRLTDNRWTELKIRVMPWDAGYADRVVTRTVIDRPLGAVAALRVAKYQVGDRYVLGAAGPDAFDCSGLIQYAYKHSTGRSLPHSSSAIKDLGRRISRSEARAGDLVWVPGHIAFYAGSGRVVEAANPRTDVVYRAMWQQSPAFIRL